VTALSAWVQLMLAEITRKREEEQQACAEQTRRAAEEAAQHAGGRDAAPACGDVGNAGKRAP
jgi:hypothetical protein